MEPSSQTIGIPFGFINLWKPKGVSSTRVGCEVRRILHDQYGLSGKKRQFALGHLGTLDPGAEGVLPLAVGKATRLIPYSTDRCKTYRFTLVLGSSTVSGDATGEVLTTRPIHTDCVEHLRKVLPQFQGRLQQIPPMVSALHHHGQRLYELARAGQVVERQPRDYEIFALELLDHHIESQDAQWAQVARISLRVHCSEGTYIRSLCEDLAVAIGSLGHMDELLREVSGPFRLESTVGLADIAAGQAGVLLDPRELIVLPQIELQGAEYQQFCSGQRIPVGERIHACEAAYVLFKESASALNATRIIGISRVEQGILWPKAVFA